MHISSENQRHLLQASLGHINSQLLIRNARLVNVLTGEIYPANIFVDSGIIAHVEYKDLSRDLDKAEEVIDAAGAYLLPGFVDAHVHIESSMMTPANFARAVLPHGTTTVITDPHEIANVWGVKGVKYMHEASEDLPMRQFIDIPSCVPSVPGLENGGASFLAPEIHQLSSLDRVIGLAEVMDFVGVAQGDERMMEILEAAQSHGLYIQGHAPNLSGRLLSAYRCGGPCTCHETASGEEALEKLRSGFTVDARDSSIVKNVANIWAGISHLPYLGRLCFCTDDREADEILEHGHVNDVVRHAITCGMDPIMAIRSATYQAAQEAHIDNLGAIAPGFAADFLLTEDLQQLQPTHVFCRGRLVARNGKLTTSIPERVFPLETWNSISIRPLTVQDLTVSVPAASDKARIRVLEYTDPVLPFTQRAEAVVQIEQGNLILEDPDMRYVAVINRYPNRNTIGLGVVKGFGLRKGTIASTVSHDCHNMIVVYDNPENALLAVKTLCSCGGGMCAVEDRRILHTLELPIGGLMSPLDAETLAEQCRAMKEAMRHLGLVEIDNPLLRIVTMALPVVPDLKITDLGLVDVLEKRVVPLLID